ncbi:MAG: FHA domain-containing protein [Gemmatimonadetes bacterium]|jgi:adenylate cyclase|nr:FHA domain-containing protein [Gemmatimonadota bacterium]
MLGELIPCGGGDPIPLLKAKLLIGRRSRCDITLRFPNVSSHHCELELCNGYWSVRDLGSRNGVKVNGVRCQSKWLMPGDIVSVAKHRYELVYTPTGDGPPPEEDDPFAISLLEKAGLVQEQTDKPGLQLGLDDAPGNSAVTSSDNNNDKSRVYRIDDNGDAP